MNYLEHIFFLLFGYGLGNLVLKNRTFGERFDGCVEVGVAVAGLILFYINKT